MLNMKKQVGRYIGFVALPLLVTLAVSCARETTIVVGGGTSPTFTVSGSGRLTSLQIFGPASSDPEVKLSLLLWQIERDATAPVGTSLDDLGSISFGQVPVGYVQRFPLAGQPPVQLTEGANYRAQLDSTDAGGMVLQFGIRGGQAIKLTSVSNRRNIPTH